MSLNRPELLIVERILRDRDDIWRQINEERDLKPLTVQMLIASAVSLAAYGAVLGASNSLWQAMSSVIKLPLLFLATLAICLPTLYLFNLVFGARLSMQQAVALIMVSVTVTSVLTLAFAPISLFFLISAKSYSFFKLLNVCILMLTAIVGLRYLTVGMRALNDHHEALAFATSSRVEQPVGQPAALAAPAVAASVPAGDAPAAVPAGSPSPQPGVEPAATPVAVPAGVPAGAPAEAPAGQPVAVPASAPGSGNGAGQPVTLPVHPLPAGSPVPGAGLVPVQGRYPHLVPQPAEARPTVGAGRPASMSLLYVWIVLFGFVGTQLAWTLRPFFGSPGEPFQIFRHIEGTFYSDILRTIGHLLGG